MVSIKWCMNQKQGIKISEPNENISDSYINMAEESINALNDLKKSRIWIATTSYYIFYYSLYSLMLKIGIKCEIHSCSIEFMKQYLKDYYNQKDLEMIKKAFSARIDIQYYTNRPVDQKVIEEIKIYCKDFYTKTKDILSGITKEQIKKIREELESV